MVTECSIEGCSRRRESRQGWCLLHYKRWKRHGDPLVVQRVSGSSLDARSHKIDRTGDCWLWTGATDDDGYPVIRVGGRVYRGHRLAYEQWVGPIPNGMCVCHTCDTPNCVRPEHLWLGTNPENTADKMKKGRWGGGRSPSTHCAHNHEMTGDNVRYEKSGRRYCVTCRSETQKRYRARKKVQ